MERLEPRTWRQLFDAVYEINTARDHTDFISAAAAAASRLIPADHCAAHVVDRATGRLVARSVPADPFTDAERAHYAAAVDDMPLVAYFARTGDQRARRMSDVIPTAAYRRTPHYRACLSRLGFVYCLAVPIVINARTVAGLSYDRRRSDFTTRHCQLLDAFAPHLRQAWLRHPDPWAEGRAHGPSRRDRLRQLGLTPRETDVLAWMIEGKQNREIAGILELSLYTVQDHVANIVRKLGQENRHAATVHALSQLSAG